MPAYYPRKSHSKRKKIFEVRTRKLVAHLIQAVASSDAKFVTKGTIKKSAKIVARNITSKMANNNLERLLFSDKIFSYEELIGQIKRTMNDKDEFAY